MEIFLTILEITLKQQTENRKTALELSMENKTGH